MSHVMSTPNEMIQSKYEASDNTLNSLQPFTGTTACFFSIHCEKWTTRVT